MPLLHPLQQPCVLRGRENPWLASLSTGTSHSYAVAYCLGSDMDVCCAPAQNAQNTDAAQEFRFTFFTKQLLFVFKLIACMSAWSTMQHYV
jgi:hypothetical protein